MTELLLIDPDSVQRQRLSGSLNGAGFSVSFAECVLSAVEQARRYAPEIIVSYEYLPGLNCIEFLGMKRFIPALVDVPLLVYGPSTKNMSALFRAGAEDFILSPVDIQELQLRVRAVTRRFRNRGVIGDFGHFPASDILQMMVSTGRTGVFEIDAGLRVGRLYFKDGNVVYAQAKELKGEAAFLALLKEASKGGQFVFTSGPLPAHVANVEKPTAHLLLSLANVIDEG